MDFSPRLTQVKPPHSCRLVQSGRHVENREIYMAQSKLTKNGQRAELPTLEQARKINRGN
jgi:hypothetical protein